MKAKIRSYLLPCLLAVMLVLALVPALMPSAQAADTKTPVATTYNEVHYLDGDTLVKGYRPFYTIDDAWEAALKGEPIKLTADWDTGTKGHERILTVPSGGSATVYLNGHTIDHDGGFYTDAGAIFRVESNAYLKVDGEDASGKRGTLYGGNTAVDYDKGQGRGGAVRVDAGAKLIMDKVIVEGCSASNNGGGIWAIDGASVTLTNVDFVDCITTEGTGGAIYVENASLTVDNCKFMPC